MLQSDLNRSLRNTPPPVVCAVSYLNTSPLVWGFERTHLGQQIRLEYELPSVCADRVRDHSADIGILPVIEIARQDLDWLPSTGIACRGAVRSILLISKTPLSRIRSIAGDIGSRTSVMLARVLLAERFGCEPEILPMHADLEAMLRQADAALIIGDPALRLDPVALGQHFEVWDLGEQWWNHTGLPMVFALWAGRRGHCDASLDLLFAASCRYGIEHLEEVLASECPRRGLPIELGRAYFTRHIALELNARDLEGMHAYLKLARALDNLKVSIPVTGTVTV